MSVLSDLEAKLGIVETDVVKFFTVTLPADVAKAEAELQTIAQKFDDALQWVGAHGQEIAADVAGLLGIVAALGTGIPAPVLTAAAGLNSALALVNQAIAAQQAAQASGASALAQAVSAGSAAYQALKASQSATAVAQAHVAAGAK